MRCSHAVLVSTNVKCCRGGRAILVKRWRYAARGWPGVVCRKIAQPSSLGVSGGSSAERRAYGGHLDAYAADDLGVGEDDMAFANDEGEETDRLESDEDR